MDIIKDYDIITDLNIDLLKKEVKERIKNGWRPQGGVFADKDNGFPVYMQAIIRG
jgi:hypothetical protein